MNIEFNKICELCRDEFRLSHRSHTGGTVSARLCQNCESIKPEIDAVLYGTAYSSATEEQKERIYERARENRTVRRGPFFNPKDNRTGGKVQSEYERRNG